MKVRELYTDPSRWTQCQGCTDINGHRVAYDSPQAHSWCLFMAMYKCYPDPRERTAIHTQIVAKIGLGSIEWNDNPNRTFAEVKALVDELDI